LRRIAVRDDSERAASDREANNRGCARVSSNSITTAFKAAHRPEIASDIGIVARRRSRASSSIPMVIDALRIADGILLVALGWVAFVVQQRVTADPTLRFWPGYGLVTITGAFVGMRAFAIAGLHASDRFAGAGRQVAQVLMGIGCVAVFLSGLALLTETWRLFSLNWLATWLATAFVAIAVTRAGVATALRRRAAQGRLTQSVVVVGAGEYGQRLVAHLTGNQGMGFRVIGFFDDRKDRVPSHVHGFPVLGTVDDLLELGKTTEIDQVIIALPWSAETRLLEVLHKLKSLPTNISLCPDRIGFHLRYQGVLQCGAVPLVSVVDPPLGHWRGFAKACEDKALAVACLIMIAPILALIALAIRLESPGPVLFRQKRFGFNNQEIEVYKFRTMYTHMVDQMGATQASRNDPRVTRIGAFLRRTSLDELPQFLNVLMGDMSVVGPRPHPIGMRTEKLLCHEIVADYAHRHRVKPGITGWAQVNGWRGATDTAEKLQRRVEHDLYYIDNWSISFDLRILFLTVFRLFSDENAY
jgi:Undecaprenyl-phosphate glucose phosphotransferase